MSEDLHLDAKNYRIHPENNKRIIKKSLVDCGAGRSILADKDNVIIAGNGVYEQAIELGIPIKFIETDGKELVVVKRTDLSTNDEKRKILALADNHSSDTSMFDMDVVLDDFTLEDLDIWEFELDDEIELLEDLKENGFINTVKADAETFDFTLNIPKEQKGFFDDYVKENTKLPLVELLINHIQNA